MARRSAEAFAEFAAGRSGALHRTAFLIVGDRQLAEDLVQEALVKTYVAWPRLREPENASAYARKVIANTAVSWFRRKGWSAERPSGDLPERAGGSAENGLAERDRIWRALRALPLRQRTVLVLRYYEDLTEAQTAAAMDCAVGTVKSQTFAGLRNMRETLGSEFELGTGLDEVVN